MSKKNVRGIVKSQSRFLASAQEKEGEQGEAEVFKIACDLARLPE
jgi:hypothetical protein